MEVIPVQRDMVPQVTAFLSERPEFGHSRNWGPLFEYPWKLERFPYGYAIFDADRVGAFLGTIFAERNLHGRPVVCCNMTTWIVDDEFRKRLGPEGRGLGRKLVAPILAHKNVVITNLTPTEPSAKSCEKLGFNKLEEKQIATPVLPWLFGGDLHQVIFDPVRIQEYLRAEDLMILSDHRSLPCTHFLIKDCSSSAYCYGIGTTSSLGKLPQFKAKWLNICYLSSPNVFASHFRAFKRALWRQDRILVVRYDSRLIPYRLSRFQRIDKQKRIFHSFEFSASQVDNLYSELLTYNKY